VNDNLFKEDLSIAYLRAICARAEVTFNLQNRDEDGSDVDLNKTVSLDLGNEINALIKVQLKSTGSEYFYREEYGKIIYKAKKKCYEDLTKRRTTPLYLFLLILPKDKNDWISCNVDELILRKCMYWTKLEKGDKELKSEFIDIYIDKDNRVNPETLNYILKKVGENI
jgi:hypothetical protein